MSLCTPVSITKWFLKRQDAFISPMVKENYLVKLIKKSFEEIIYEIAYISTANSENGPVGCGPLLVIVNEKLLSLQAIS